MTVQILRRTTLATILAVLIAGTACAEPGALDLQLEATKMADNESDIGALYDVVFVNSGMSNLKLPIPADSQVSSYFKLHARATDTSLADSLRPTIVCGNALATLVTPDASQVRKLGPGDTLRLRIDLDHFLAQCELETGQYEFTLVYTAWVLSETEPPEYLLDSKGKPRRHWPTNAITLRFE